MSRSLTPQRANQASNPKQVNKSSERNVTRSCLFRFLYLSLLLHTQEPTLRLIIIQLKYADWRRAFLIAWRGVGMLGSEATVDDRAELVLQALEATCRAQHLEGDDNLSDQSKAWVENLGHNIAYVSSPLSLLGRLGVVKKCPRSRKGALRRRGHMCVGCWSSGFVWRTPLESSRRRALAGVGRSSFRICSRRCVFIVQLC